MAFKALIEGIAERGYAVVPGAVPPSLVRALRGRAREVDALGGFAPARVGRAEGRMPRTDIRGDRIAWLDASSPAPAELPLFAWLEQLRTACNRELMLGLAEIEAHYAIYPPGAGYSRHRDRFRDDDSRTLSCVLYLNEGWRAEDGGALRLLLPDAAPFAVHPRGGTFVAFLSADLDHEVLPATRERMALAGWYRRRALPP
ncbi:MAG TPA: 2OG-Fe(II) oxygenase [Casimicrobiaceae bacterium]|nr:2OG-Fe(II) oxygenase [Casimicrobiaceae bacterium]